MMKLLLFAPMCVLLFAAPVKAEMVGVRALALTRSADMPERYLRTDEGYKLLTFKSTHPSTLIDAHKNKGERLSLFEKSIDANQKPAYLAVEQVKLPIGAKSILLLGSNLGSAPNYLAIDDSFLDAKYNNWLMINTCSKPIAFQIGEDEKPFLIKANSIEKCNISPPKGKGAAVLGKAVWNGSVRKFYSTFWPIREGERSIVIFIERNNRISVKKISDTLLEKKATDMSR